MIASKLSTETQIIMLKNLSNSSSNLIWPDIWRECYEKFIRSGSKFLY